MKKELVLSALFLCCFTLMQAQPVLDASIIPGPGSKWLGLFVQVDPAEYSAGVMGSGQTWDFTGVADSLEGTPQEIIDELKEAPFLAFEVLAPNGLLGADSFPQADFAIRTLIDFFVFSDNYAFIDQRSDGLYDLGNTSITEFEFLGTLIEDTTTVVYQTPPLGFKLPLSFGEHFIRVEEQIDEDMSFGTRTVTNTRDSIVYDAYGSLATPFASFDNAVRFTFYTTQTSVTTTLATGTVISNTTTNSVSYEFYSPDQLAPLVDYDPPLAGEEEDGATLSFYVQTDVVLSQEDVEKRASLALKVAPNPAIDQIQVSFGLDQSEEQIQAYLFDMKGQVLRTENWNGLASGPQQQNFQLPNHLSTGTYVLLVRGSTFTGHQKVVIRK